MVIVVASGGAHNEGFGMEAYDYETPYLPHIRGFIGITDITFVQAGGTMSVAQWQVTTEEFLAPLLQQAAAAVDK